MATTNPMSPEDFRKATDVSHETLDRLTVYADLLRKWQPKINLVGPSTVPDLWARHMLDSAQLFPLVPPGEGPLVDLGSGAGFPGLVLAIMGAADVHLVESDQRKSVFLREVIRATGAGATVHCQRIESLNLPRPARCVSARALAPIEKLLGLSAGISDFSTIFLFLKGENCDEELTDSQKNWNMVISTRPSLTSPAGLIVQLAEISRKNGPDS